MITDLNAHFNPLPRMTRVDFEVLCKEGRLWSTRARFNQIAALLVMGPPPVGFHYPVGEVYYQGYVITNRHLDLQEAKDIAGRRGWKEEVVWLVQNTLPLGENPMQLFNN